MRTEEPGGMSGSAFRRSTHTALSPYGVRGARKRPCEKGRAATEKPARTADPASAARTPLLTDSSREATQNGQVLPVGDERVVLRRLEKLRNPGEAGVGHQVAEPGAPDGAKADVLVPVDARAAWLLR